MPEERLAVTEADRQGGVCSRPSLAALFRPITGVQRLGLLGFLIISAVDVVLSAFLFFGAGGAYVEANPVLAWATEGLFLFLVAVLGVKAIGAGVIAVLVSLANRFCTFSGDAVLFAALCTTTSLFLLELVTVGAAPVLFTIDLLISSV